MEIKDLIDHLDKVFAERDRRLDKIFEERDRRLDKIFAERDRRLDKIFEERDRRLDKIFEERDRRLDKIFEERDRRLDKRFEEQTERIEAQTRQIVEEARRDLSGQIRQTDVKLEDLRSQTQLVAEGVVANRERHDKFREEVRKEFDETRTLIKVSYSDLDRRSTERLDEQGERLDDHEERLSKIEAAA
jgi:DNA anti-recombination protein RmuC